MKISSKALVFSAIILNLLILDVGSSSAPEHDKEQIARSSLPTGTTVFPEISTLTANNKTFLEYRSIFRSPKFRNRKFGSSKNRNKIQYKK